MYNEQANSYDKYFAKNEAVYESDANNLIIWSNISPNSKRKVLDFGCGTGEHAKFLLQKTDWDLVCFDISEEMISVAKEKLKPFSDRVTFCNDLSDLRTKFDLVYSLFFVFNHIVDQEIMTQSLLKIRECLKTDSLFISDFYRYERLTEEPPKDYIRIEGNIKKSVKVKSEADFYKIQYSIHDFLTSENIQSEIRIKAWSISFLTSILQMNVVTDLTTNFSPADGNEYQNICVLR